MAPLKAPRCLDADIEKKRVDDRNIEYAKSLGPVPALDLSKFPAKKILGVGKKTSKTGTTILKKTEQDKEKRFGTRQIKSVAPQVVKAPQPPDKGTARPKGSMAFAHKARGMGDCYMTWAAAGDMEKSPSNCWKAGGRYGRMTSIEIDVHRADDEMSSKGCMNLQSMTDNEIIEEDMWLADPKNSASSTEMYEDTWADDHECEPPCLSSDAGNESGDCSLGSEPPQMSLGSFDFDTVSLFVEHKTGNVVMGSEIHGVESISMDGSQGDAPYIIQQAMQQPSEPKRLLNDSAGPNESNQISDAVSKEDIETSAVQLVKATTGAHKGGSKTASTVRPHHQRALYGIPRSSSLDCPPSPSSLECPQPSPSSEEDFSLLPDARLALVPSCEKPKESTHGIDSSTKSCSLEINYRESTESTTRRRGSLGFAKRVLGVTFGITVNTVMLVSGVTVAKAIWGRGDRKSREEVLKYCANGGRTQDEGLIEI